MGIPRNVGYINMVPQVYRIKIDRQNRGFRDGIKALVGSAIAWQAALFMGLQSLTFYVILAWLHAMLLDRGYDANYSGWMLSLCQVTGILGSLIIPTLAGKRRNQRLVVTILVLLDILGLVGLLLPSFGVVPLLMAILGFVLGGTFGLALLFLVLRTKDAQSATELSGMARSIGYFVAAMGPILFRSLYDMTSEWTYGLLLLLVLAVLKFFKGWGAGMDGTV
jgi:CP family cyanate transporter-like MFS transporter